MSVFGGLITVLVHNAYLPTVSVGGWGVDTHNTGTWDAQAGGLLQVQAWPELHSKYKASQGYIHSKILSQKTKQEKQTITLPKCIKWNTLNMHYPLHRLVFKT